MRTKLTLTLEDDTIRKAKLYSKHTGRSLSKLIENYLEMLMDGTIDRSRLSPKLNNIVGVVKLPQDFNEKSSSPNEFLNNVYNHPFI